MDLLIVFITGLTVGGLTCLAVQGGLLASIIAARTENQSDSKKKIKSPDNRTQNTFSPILAFLISKLVAYTILGFILGAFGRVIGISQNVQIAMQFVAGLYMVAVALNLLNVHPFFRYVVIQPPRFLTRIVRNQSKSKDLFAPAFLGAMTIFIPCGTTLAMEALAISSANPFMGAATMFVFVLGTTPLFFGVGWLTSVLGDNFRGKFLKFAAIAVLYLGITSINGSLNASGSPVTLETIAENFPIQINLNPRENQMNAQPEPILHGVSLVGGVQSVDLNVTSNGYSPNLITVKSGEPVKLNLKATGAYSCASAFRIPSLGISKNLQPNGLESIEFTPKNPGKIAFTCSMGMYRGVIEVI